MGERIFTSPCTLLLDIVLEKDGYCRRLGDPQRKLEINVSGREILSEMDGEPVTGAPVVLSDRLCTHLRWGDFSVVTVFFSLR